MTDTNDKGREFDKLISGATAVQLMSLQQRTRGSGSAAGGSLDTVYRLCRVAWKSFNKHISGGQVVKMLFLFARICYVDCLGLLM